MRMKTVNSGKILNLFAKDTLSFKTINIDHLGLLDEKTEKLFSLLINLLKKLRRLERLKKNFRAHSISRRMINV